jgi:hypothetical protein
MSKITVVDYPARRGDTGSTCTPESHFGPWTSDLGPRTPAL